MEPYLPIALAGLLFSATLFGCAGNAEAAAMNTQIQTNKDVDALKKEVIRRADINLYPVFGIPKNLMEETVGNIQTLDADEWTAAYEKEGDRFFTKAQNEETTDKAAALPDYQMAQRFYYMGRWPSARTESRVASYQKEREAFAEVEKIRGIPLEEISYKGEEYEVVGLLAMPKKTAAEKVPLLISVGGLDGWKEARISQLEPLLDKGMGILSLDMPGTGQSGVKFDDKAMPSLFGIIQKVLKRSDIDSSRIVLYGGSFGGYWTTKLAASGEFPLAGYVDQSGPYAKTFEEKQLTSVFDGDEYLYDSLPAFCNLFDGINGRAEVLKEIQKHAIDKEMITPLTIKCPILLVGGAHDSLVPVDDLLSVFRSEGGIREFWLNPNGIHMGRERGAHVKWNDSEIYQKVIFPWIEQQVSQSEDK